MAQRGSSGEGPAHNKGVQNRAGSRKGNGPQEKNGSNQKGRFIYGNYNRYYGYRLGAHASNDPRMKFLRREWFEGKHCLDVGCNEGVITIYIAREFRTASMVGIDIDPELIAEARQRLRQEEPSWAAQLASGDARATGAGCTQPEVAELEPPGTAVTRLERPAEPGASALASVRGVGEQHVAAGPGESAAAEGETTAHGAAAAGFCVLGQPTGGGLGLWPSRAGDTQAAVALGLADSPQPEGGDAGGSDGAGVAAAEGGVGGAHDTAAGGGVQNPLPGGEAGCRPKEGSSAEAGVGAPRERDGGAAEAARGGEGPEGGGGRVSLNPPNAGIGAPNALQNGFSDRGSEWSSAAQGDPQVGRKRGRPEDEPGVQQQQQQQGQQQQQQQHEEQQQEQQGGEIGGRRDVAQGAGKGRGVAVVGRFGSSPFRVHFMVGNVLAARFQERSFDVVLCLSVTKWVHLNWGDSGLITLFCSMYSALRPGGMLILEPQPWKSYTKNRGVSLAAQKHFREITMRPNSFREILLDKIGFERCVVATQSVDPGKGFGRPLMLFYK